MYPNFLLTQAPPPSGIKQLHSLEIELKETLLEKDAIVSTLKQRVACGKVRRCYQGHAHRAKYAKISLGQSMLEAATRRRQRLPS
jgi:hypothetical protein